MGCQKRIITHYLTTWAGTGGREERGCGRGAGLTGSMEGGRVVFKEWEPMPNFTNALWVVISSLAEKLSGGWLPMKLNACGA
jgi:hypothetical protein